MDTVFPADGYRARKSVRGGKSSKCLGNSGGSALVSMMKAAHFGDRNDLAHLRRLHGSLIRRILPERKMAPRTVVIIEVRGHMPPERRLIHYDYMVQAFSTDGADQPFYVWALPGRSRSGEHFDDLHARRLRPEGDAIDAITVSEQIPRRHVPWECLHELRCSPFGGRMLRHVEMHDAPAIMSQNEEHVQDPETHGRLHEEVY